MERRCVTAEQQCLDRLCGGIDDDGVAAGKEFGKFVAQLLAQLVVEVGERLPMPKKPILNSIL